MFQHSRSWGFKSPLGHLAPPTQKRLGTIGGNSRVQNYLAHPSSAFRHPIRHVFAGTKVAGHAHIMSMDVSAKPPLSQSFSICVTLAWGWSR